MTSLTCSVDSCGKSKYQRGWCMTHYTRMRKTGSLDLVTRFTCTVCSVEVVKHGTGPKPKYCSRSCSRSPLRKPPPADGRCMGCNAILPQQGAGKTRKYCRTSCVHLKVRRPASRQCTQCDAVIDMTLRTSDGRLRYPLYTKVCEACRKPRRYPITLAQLVERDGPECAGCETEVDLMLTWPDPFSPSIDHVIPWSRGGAHEVANLQLMHLRCNVIKGVRLDK